jgi:tRNA pseudouridine13 synthase
MKVKCQPEDFRVEEMPTADPGPTGRFTYYRLTKRGMGTLEALDLVRRRWNIAQSRIRYGGLKDRHALTTQYLTILGGPDRALSEPRFTLEPLGKLAFPYGPAHFRGNRFVLVIRDMTRKEVEHARRETSLIPRDGLPNYFDDQRFGSMTTHGEFPGHAWLLGDAEKALRLAIAAPNPQDRAGQKAIRSALRECWGRWEEAKARLPRSHERSLVTYLIDHPTDFAGAFARMNRDVRSLYFAAFQGHLWNLLLGRWIEANTRPDQRLVHEFKSATLPIPRDLDDDQARLFQRTMLPLPSARTKLAEGPLRDLATEALAPFGLTWEQMRVRKLDDVFLSKGQRAVAFYPKDWHSSFGDDALYPGRTSCELAFKLPKGSYATLVVKRLTDA